MTADNTTLAGLSNERSFELLVESVTDYAIYMLTPSGHIATWNTGARRFKGYSTDEIIGRHFSDFYTPEDRADGKPERALEKARTEGRFEGEGWRVRKDGSRFWAHVVIDPIRNEAGELIGFAKITRDVTERREAAEALEQARAALFQAQKMEAIGKLTGGIAHDFNNLLTVIVNSLELVGREQVSPVSRRMLESAQRAANRGAALTQQLLAFARNQPLQPARHDPNKLIEGFESVLRRACRDRAAFELALAPDAQAVQVDAAQFEVALLNLVVNARDAFTDAGRIRIATATVEVDAQRRIGSLAPGSYVQVTVTDNGSGMPPEVVQRAFDPFFTTKEVGKGSGLGLSQVYGFVTQSGGDVVIESQPGAGTSVHLYLPAAGEAGTGDRGDEGKPTALIVEDEPDVLTIASELFRALGFEVITADNGVEALEILERARRVDLVFSDVMMPRGISGVELGRRTRKLRPETKVVLASGYPLPALEAEYGHIGDFTFIAKPYRFDDLANKVTLHRGTLH